MKFRQWMGRLVSAKSFGPGVLEFEGGCSKAECLKSCCKGSSSCSGIYLTRCSDKGLMLSLILA